MDDRQIDHPTITAFHPTHKPLPRMRHRRINSGLKAEGFQRSQGRQAQAAI
jgi:hypothetical protein